MIQVTRFPPVQIGSFLFRIAMKPTTSIRQRVWHRGVWPRCRDWLGVRFCAALFVGLVLGRTHEGFSQQEPARQSEAFQKFTQHWGAGEKAVAAGEFELAASHFEQVAAVFPYEPTTRFQLACCWARQGQTDRALSELELSIRYGWQDAEALRGDEHLASLQIDPRLAELIVAADECLRESYLVYAGKNLNRSRPVPVLVLLQGLGCGPRAELPYWSAAADDLGWLIVAPRAATKVGPMLFGWHRARMSDSQSPNYFDVLATEKCIETAMQDVRREYTIDENQIYLAGFSQGGGVALHLLREPDHPYQGAVVFCGLNQQAGVDAWREAYARRRFSVAVLAGSLDPLLPRSQTLVEDLKSAAVPYQFVELPEAGHEYPSDFAARIRSALDFIASPAATSTR